MATTKTSNIGLQKIVPGDEKEGVSVEKKLDRTYEKHVEDAGSNDDQTNLHYDEEDEEPELHARTYMALFAMFILNGVQVLALLGPPAVVSDLIKRKTQVPMTLLTISLTSKAELHRHQPERSPEADLDTQLPFTRSSRPSSRDISCFGYLSSSEEHPRCIMSHIFDRSRHRTGLKRYL